jgi:uncharacterized RDD family membrane protein YckC
MKCPKCGYLGFETVDRCRNCGYDFSLSPAADVLELPLKPVPADPGPRQTIDDLPFLNAASVSEPARRLSSARGDDQRTNGGEASRVSHAAELPLFGNAIPDDLPLITRPSAPRPPLAVRRATPEVPRLRTMSGRAATLELELDPPVRGGDRKASEPIDRAVPDDDNDAAEDAALGARFAAFVTDLLIIAVTDVAVVYFTMQICGISLQELRILPRIPLIAFLVVQNGGYLVAFTAGGQTLGKMMVGIRVVPAAPSDSLDLGRAFVRELVWLVLAAPAGLGLLTVLSRDRRGVHDRFAGTRVVRY